MKKFNKFNVLCDQLLSEVTKKKALSLSFIEQNMYQFPLLLILQVLEYSRSRKSSDIRNQAWYERKKTRDKRLREFKSERKRRKREKKEEYIDKENKRKREKEGEAENDEKEWVAWKSERSIIKERK